MIEREFYIATAELQRTAPKQWARFVAVFEQYALKAAQNCVSSPSADLHVAQGRAQEARDILKAMHECLKVADELEKMKNARPQASSGWTY